MILERFIYLAAGLPLFWLSNMLHGLAQAWAAYALGDHEMPRRWRTSVDPRLYFDPLGSVLFGLTWLMGLSLWWGGLVPVGAGWGRSPEIRPGALRNPQWGVLVVALAGPLSHLVQAVLWYVAAAALGRLDTGLAAIPFMGAAINLVLAVFQLIPLPPLDGAAVLANLLSRRGAVAIENLHPGLSFLILWIGMSLPPVNSLVLVPAQLLAQALGGLGLLGLPG